MSSANWERIIIGRAILYTALEKDATNDIDENYADMGSMTEIIQKALELKSLNVDIALLLIDNERRKGRLSDLSISKQALKKLNKAKRLLNMYDIQVRIPSNVIEENIVGYSCRFKDPSRPCSSVCIEYTDNISHTLITTYRRCNRYD